MFVVWTISLPFPERSGFRYFPFSLYTFNKISFEAWLGIAISFLPDEGFPEFEKFYFQGFPWSTQIYFKSCVSTNSTTQAF
jgi:hypothetical protein